MGIAYSEEILINMKVIDKATAPIKRLVQTMKTGIGLNQQQVSGIGRTKKMMTDMNRTSMNSVKLSQANKHAMMDLFTGVTPKTAKFRDVMAMSHEDWRNFNKEGRRFKGLGARIGNTMKKLTHGLRGFRMEMLGVMFFGMGMKKFFTGLLQPALQLVGVFDIFRTTLQILFLPVAMMILDWAIWLLEKVSNLGEGTKKFIGMMVLFGAIIGGALFLVGMFALGIGSMILAFGGLLGMLGKIVLGGWIAKLIAGFIGLSLAIPGVSALGDAFGIVKGAISSVWEKIKESEAMRKLVEALGIEVEEGQTPWEALKETVDEKTKGIRNTIKKFVDDLREKLGVTKEGVLEYKEKLKGWWENFSNFFEDIWILVEDVFMRMNNELTGGEENWKEWSEAVGKYIKNLWNDISPELEKMARWTLIIGGAVTGGKIGGVYGMGVGAAAGLIAGDVAFNRPPSPAGYEKYPEYANIGSVNMDIKIDASAAPTDEVYDKIKTNITRDLVDELNRKLERVRG